MSRLLAVEHRALSIEYDALVGMKRHGGKARPIWRTRRTLDCTCGQPLGIALDYIDARRRWREHMAAAAEGQQG